MAESGGLQDEIINVYVDYLKEIAQGLYDAMTSISSAHVIYASYLGEFISDYNGNAYEELATVYKGLVGDLQELMVYYSVASSNIVKVAEYFKDVDMIEANKIGQDFSGINNNTSTGSDIPNSPMDIRAGWMDEEDRKGMEYHSPMSDTSIESSGK